MKKIVSLMLVLMMTVLALAGCGGSGGGSAADGDVSADSLKTIGDIIQLESSDSQFAVYEDSVVYAFKLGDKYYRAKAGISAEDAQSYFDIDYSNEDYEDQQKAILTPLEISEIEDLSDQILSQEQLDALAGKTGQELIDEGWTFSGHDLESMVFWMNYGPFQYNVYFDGEVPEAEYDSFEDEEGTKDLKVKSAELSMLGDATYIEE